jgi:TonB family protein
MRRFGWLVMAPMLMGAVAPERPKAEPLGNPAYWVTPEDYPAEALHARRAGIVSFRLDIDERGDVSKCTVTGSSGTPILDQTACDLLSERGKFIPPVDADGKPARTYYLSRVRWQIPGAEPFEPVDGSIEFDLDTNGNASNCKATGQLDAKELLEMCDMVTFEARRRVRSSKPVHVKLRSVVEVTPQPGK